MGLLNGGGADFLGSVFSGLYLSATLYKQQNVYDAYGELTVSEVSYPCRAQVDNQTEAMRQAEGASETDRRILVLSKGLAVAVDTDCEILINEGPYQGARFACSAIGRDPCGAYHEMRGRRA